MLSEKWILGWKSTTANWFFFSPENHDPNFNLPTRKDFDENIDGVYYANILKACYTQEEAEIYVESRRAVLPVNYFNRRILDDDTGDASDDNDDDASANEPIHNIKQEPNRNANDSSLIDLEDNGVEVDHT